MIYKVRETSSVHSSPHSRRRRRLDSVLVNWIPSLLLEPDAKTFLPPFTIKNHSINFFLSSPLNIRQIITARAYCAFSLQSLLDIECLSQLTPMVSFLLLQQTINLSASLRSTFARDLSLLFSEEGALKVRFFP